MTPWLQELPTHWQRIKLKYAARHLAIRADSRPDHLPYVGLENIQSHTGRMLGEQRADDEVSPDGTSTVNLFEKGDILFGKLRPYLAKGWVCQFAGACTTEALVLRPAPFVSAPYLLYAILSSEFIRDVDATTFGSKMPRADWDDIGNLEVPLPPPAEQEWIYSYLHRETAHLDELIVEKQYLLNLLAEKRRTLVTQSTTKGLNPNSPKHDSGIPWLGEIPTHWQIERAKWLFVERDERSKAGEEELLTVSHLTGVTTRAEKDVNMFMAESLEGYKRCEAGDLVINTLWAWMGAMGTAKEPGIVSPAYNVYQPIKALTPDYLDRLVRTPRFVQEVTRFSKGVWSSRLRLYPEGLYEVWLPVPPVHEQHAIVAYVKAEIQKLTELSSETKRTTELLHERRSALISAAVSGNLEQAVRNAN